MCLSPREKAVLVGIACASAFCSSAVIGLLLGIAIGGVCQ
jgi:hypothetical protein